MSDIYKYVKTNYTIKEFYNYSELPEYNKLELNEGFDDLFGVEQIPICKQPKEWKIKQTYSSENDFVKHYGNPLCSLFMVRYTIVVKKTDDKVSIKLFSYQRERLVGKKFFKVRTEVKFLTFNNKTSSLYVGNLINYHKKRKFTKSIRKNFFSENPILRFENYILNITEKDQIIKKDVLTAFFNNIKNYEKYKNYSGIEILYKNYLDHYGIKTPNNWASFIQSYPQPNKKDYVKNKLKFIDSFMNLSKLKGDRIRKILHNVNSFDSGKTFHELSEAYGYDFIISQKDDILTSIFENSNYSSPSLDIKQLSKNEKNKSFDILKLVFKGDIDIYTFNDHVSMILRLRKFEDVRWQSTDKKSFVDEHINLTNRLSFYTKGRYSRVYSDSFLNLIEHEINIGGTVYYPVVLRNSNDYNTESLIQSNCVKTYIEKASSMIVSLRKGSIDSDDRATIEFIIKNENGKIKFNRVQTLGRFNKTLSDEWKEPVKTLDNLLNSGGLLREFKLPELIVDISYKTFKSSSKFEKKDGYFDSILIWDNEIIYNLQRMNYIGTPLPLLENNNFLDLP